MSTTESQDLFRLNATTLTSNYADVEVYNMSDNATVAAETAVTETERCRLFRFLLYTVVCGLLCLLGFMGNTMSFLVLTRDRSTPVASFLLQVMAIADNLFLVLWFIHYSVRDVFRYFMIDAKQHPSWIYTRVYTFPIMYMAQMETIWLTVVVAMNRYMAVCLPYRAPHLCTINNVYKEVIFVTIFSTVYNVPRYFELSVTRTDNFTVQWARTQLGQDTLYKTVYTDAMYYLFTFVLPLLILGFVNTRVIIAYRATQVRRRRMTSRRSDNENNITLVMIMVVAIFMLCQAPARIVQIIWSYSYKHCEEFIYYLIHISNSLEVLNSSINFLIYFIFRKRFRDILGEYYCTYGPMRYRRESSKSITTEGLALSEYQPTTATSTVRGSLRKFLRQDSKMVDNCTQSNGIRESDKATATLHEQVPLSSESSHGVANSEGRGEENITMENVALQQDDVGENHHQIEHIMDSPSHQTNSTQTQSAAKDAMEMELSSENPHSRSSSPETTCAETDDHMLVASV